MKSTQILLLLILILSVAISCKNDTVEKPIEVAKTQPVENTSRPDNSITAVDKIYRSNEVDTPALISASCNAEENKARCSQIKLREYITNNLVKPNGSKEIKAREVITFTVMPNGSIGANIRSISKKEVCSGCKDAAIKVLSSMPHWIPAMKDGKPVAMSMTVPVMF